MVAKSRGHSVQTEEGNACQFVRAVRVWLHWSLHLQLEQRSLAGKELLGRRQTIHLCCPRVGTAIKVLLDPVAIWLDLGLVCQLVIPVSIVILHVLLLLGLLTLPLGDGILEALLLGSQGVDESVCSV